MVNSMLKSVAAATFAVSALGLTDTVKQNVRKNFGNNRLISVHGDQFTDRVVELLHEHSFDDVGKHNGAMHIRLSPEAVTALNQEGVEFEDHTERFLSEMEKNLNSPNFFCTEGTEACARKTQEDFYASYHDIETYYQRLEDLAATNTEMNYFETIGYSWEGRALKVLFIGDQTKPLVFYFCNIHAREWITPPFCTYMAETLINGGAGHPLLEKFSFAILPSANPDGFVFSYTENNAWRKTRKPNPGQTCMGTDGNRNYPIGFAGEGASTNACSETYAGHSPLDQNETAAIAAFGQKYKGRLYAYNDAHSYGEYWMSPWAGTYDLPPAEDYDKMLTCMQATYDAILAVNNLPFKIGSVANTIYIAAGGSVDYYYQEIGVTYAYTLEARGAGLSGIAGFQPPPENILPSNQELFAGMEASLNCGFTLDFGAPTAFPTPAPTGCLDMVPNGIHFVDGTPAPCNEIEAYCSLYDFVEARCPRTCGACDAVRGDVDVSEIKIIAKKADKGFFTVSTVALVSVGAALLGVVAALAAVIVTRKEKKVDEKAVVQAEL